MKFVFSAFLATLASVSAERDLQATAFANAGALAARWDMSEPDITYEDSTDIFTFVFLTASADNYNAGLEETFWNSDCMPVDSTQTGYSIGSQLVYDPDDSSGRVLPTLEMENFLPTMTFKVDPLKFSQVQTSNPSYNIYSLQDGGTEGDQAGTASINFCIRSSLGYTAVPSDSTHSGTDASQGSGYQEVNFIETLVRVDYNMAGGFSVDAFSVAPKDRQLLTISETFDQALEAYLCKASQHPEHRAWEGVEQDGNSVNFGLLGDLVTTSGGTFPKRLTDYDPTTGSEEFNQGALINVCVKVKDEFIPQGIKLNSITSFSWLREDNAAYDQDVSNNRDGDDVINQVAIVGSGPAPNYLTSYVDSQCQGVTYCDFASVLFAQFYNTDGEVSGSGSANLMFGTRRRLGASSDGRQLQEDPGSAGMDISVPLKGNVEGPGGLKTAGGASVSAVFASVIALVGAALLA